MKRIVILCDGTWNKTDSRTPTNVVRLAQMLEGIDREGRTQVPIYVPGVGTGQGVTALSRLADRMLGGALGWGLLENIVTAYRHLVFVHEPGDEIFIFGFSRGAYTARSLTGFIRSTGIVERDSLHRIPEAVARYRIMDDPDTHPGSDRSHAFRAALSRRVATSEAERTWRRANGHADAPLLRVAYLGVWDSVGALGVPKGLSVPGLLDRRRYEFHDADLSSIVRSARHAIALDERRTAFEPTRWSNLAELNAESGAEAPPYLERFFLGDHGSVGGGGDVTALSSIALRWIVEGAQEAGLWFGLGRLEALRAEEDPLGSLRSQSTPARGLSSLVTRFRQRDRDGPETPQDLHGSVLERWAGRPGDAGAKPYRPGSLRRVQDGLEQWLRERREAASGRAPGDGA